MANQREKQTIDRAAAFKTLHSGVLAKPPDNYNNTSTDVIIPLANIQRSLRINKKNIKLKQNINEVYTYYMYWLLTEKLEKNKIRI